MKVLTFGAAAVALLLSFDYLRQVKTLKFEYPVLALLATAGMGMMISASDLIALYLGLELQSLALYVMAAIRRDDLRSSEAGLKYFVLGALSSGMLLYGASLIYGFTGSTSFASIAAVAAQPGAGQNIGLIIGLVFLLVGIAFKISAVPFHMWTPGRLRGRADARNGVLCKRAEGGGHGAVHARRAGKFRRHQAAMAAGGDGARHRFDGARRIRSHRPEQHQAAAGLLGHRQHRLRADRSRRRLAGRCARGYHLPCHLCRHDAGCFRLRAGHASARWHGGGHRRTVRVWRRTTSPWPRCSRS